MRWGLTLILVVVGLAVSALVWMLSGGKLFLFLLPLLFLGLPFLGRRK